jgi:hypothetical protein
MKAEPTPNSAAALDTLALPLAILGCAGEARADLLNLREAQ